MCRQIPIGAAHISFSGHTQIGQATSKTNPRVSLRWPRRLPGSDQHSEEHWPGGVKIKMTLRFATPRGSYRLLGKCKTKVGPCWRSFIHSKLSRGSHKTQPRKERKIKEHNTSMMETKAARVEQNTRHKAKPSTLYQIYRCINYIRDIVIFQNIHVPTWNQLQLHLQLSHFGA